MMVMLSADTQVRLATPWACHSVYVWHATLAPVNILGKHMHEGDSAIEHRRE